MPVSARGYERWLRCREKACCSAYLIFPAGDEIVNIARTLAMPIDEVVTPVPSQPSRTAYHLTPAGEAYRLALVRTRNDAQSAPSCGFLVALPEGTARCGLGALRPARCRTYPASLRNADVAIDASGCACGPWSLADLDPDVEARALRTASDAYERFAAHVAAWNAAIPPAATHARFIAHLDAAYAR